MLLLAIVALLPDQGTGEILWKDMSNFNCPHWADAV